MPPRKSNISQATATDNDGGTPVKERDGTNIEVLQPRSILPPVGPGSMHIAPNTPYSVPSAGVRAATALSTPVTPGSVRPSPFRPWPPAQGDASQNTLAPLPAQRRYTLGNSLDYLGLNAERMRIEREARDAILRENPQYAQPASLYSPPSPQYILRSNPLEMEHRVPIWGAQPKSAREAIVRMQATATQATLYQFPNPQAVHYSARNPQTVPYPAAHPQGIPYHAPYFQTSPYQASNPQAVPPQIPYPQAPLHQASVYQATNPQAVHSQSSNPRAAHPPLLQAMDLGSDYHPTQDLSLPRTMVQRLAKGVLQPNTSISKDALLALSKGATVFINYLAQAYVPSLLRQLQRSELIACTSRANEVNLATNRKNIPPAAVFEALHDLEFTDFIPRVEAELNRYNEVQTGKRNDYRRKVKEGKMGFGGKGGAGSASGGDGEGDGDEGDERAAKRVRRADGDSTISPEARRENGSGDPNTQLKSQMEAEEEDEDEDSDPPDDEEPEEGGVELRQRPGEEEEGDEEEEEEEDDEDAFPDEGMRLSSVERENYALDHPDDPVTPASSGDEEGSEEEESD